MELVVMEIVWVFLQLLAKQVLIAPIMEIF